MTGGGLGLTTKKPGTGGGLGLPSTSDAFTPAKKKKGGGGIGGLLHKASVASGLDFGINLGEDIKKSTIPAVVGIYDIGHAFQHDLSDISYRLSSGKGLTGYESNLRDIGKKVGQGYGQYYGGVGDIVHGHPLRGTKKLASNFYNHPLQPILDALTVLTLGGAGAAKLGQAGLLGERGAALATPGSKVFTIGEEAPAVGEGPVNFRTTSKPTSANPYTRAVQRLNHSILTSATGRLESYLGREVRVGEAARGRQIDLNRAARRHQTEVARDIEPFDKAFRGMSPKTQTAISIAAQGLDPVSAVKQGLAPTAYRDMIVAEMEKATQELATATTRSSKANLNTIIKAHERLLGYVDRLTEADYEAAKVHPAYEAADELMNKAREKGVDLNILDPVLAKSRPYLAARVLGGARYTPYERIAQQAMDANPERLAVHKLIDEKLDPFEARVFKETLDNRIRYFAARAGETPEEIIAAQEALWKGFDARTINEQFIPEGTAATQDALFQETFALGRAGEKVEKAKAQTEVKREHLIEKHQEDLPDTIGHEEIANRIIQEGVKLPPELMEPGALAARIQDIYENVKAGANGRFWYDTAEGVAKYISENDKAALKKGVTPKQIAQMIAVFSQSADTVANMAFLRKALDQYAEHGTVYAGLYPERQHAEILKILKGGSWEGRKRSSFYMNIIEKLDPEEYASLMKQRAEEGITTSDAANPVTVDRWVTRWFIPERDVPGAYYDGFERVIQEMAADIGWEPKEVQAAAWVATKQLSLAERHPNWPLARVEKAGEDAYNVGFDKYFGESQQRLDTGASMVHPAADRAANLANRPDGGGTLKRNLTPDESTKGFVVAHGAFEQIAVSPIKGITIQAYRDLHDALLKKDRSARVGVWHNPDNGLIYLDISRRFPSKAAALRYGRENGQLAIWDAKNFESIPTGLSEIEANRIKTRLRNEHFGPETRPPAPVEKLKTTPNPDSALEQYDALLNRIARERYGGKTKQHLSAAEHWVDETVKTRPDDPLVKRLADLQRRADAEKAPPAPEDLFQRGEELQGLPEGKVAPSHEVQSIAKNYMEEGGQPYDPPRTYREVKPEEAKKFAQEFEDMLDMLDPRATPEYRVRVKRAYDALIRETLDQYHYLVDAGYKFEFPEGAYPYESPWDAMRDLQDNKHLYVFPTEEGFGVAKAAKSDYKATPEADVDARISQLVEHGVTDPDEMAFRLYDEDEKAFPGEWDTTAGGRGKEFAHSEYLAAVEDHLAKHAKHPLLSDSGIVWNGRKATNNDIFRAVHDVFGHHKEGVGFRASGEDNAWRSHAAMYSDEARGAMTTETRGQNSWVNYGPHAEHNLKAGEADTVYADQKAGLMPEEVQEVGRTDALKQDVGLFGGRARGVFIPSGSFGGVHHIEIAKSGAVDTVIHEFGHLMETWLHGDPLERNVAANLLDKNGKRLIQPSKSGEYVWTTEAKEAFAQAVMAWERQRNTPLATSMRRLYNIHDLPDITPALSKVFDQIHQKRTLEGGTMHGGLSVPELQEALGKLIYTPHVGKTLREGSTPQAQAGEGIVSKPDLAKMNKGIRLLTSQWLPHPSAWRDGYMKVIGYANAVARHDYAWKIGKAVGPNMERNEGWYYVRESRTLPTRGQKEAEGLDKAYQDFEQASDLETFVDDNLSTASSDTAAKWTEEGFGVRQISPVAHKQIFGEFKAAGKLLKKYDNATDFWRTLTLTYRPAWLVNNAVGQTLLFAVNHLGKGGMRAYASAVLEEMKGKSSLSDDLRYGGLFRTEAPKINAAFNRFSRTEHRMRDAIQRFNAAVSDNVPRNATYKAIIRKMAKTNDKAGELGAFLKEHGGNTEKLPADLRAMHDEIVQEVLDELIDFSNLNHFERSVLRRAIPFYSWIKGIMKATLHLGFHHPARALILMLLAQDGQRLTDKAFGEGGSIVPGFLPFGKQSEGLQGGLNTQGLNPFGTVGQTVGGIQSIVSGDVSPSENAFLQTNPILQALVTSAAGVDLFSKKEKGGGRGKVFLNELLRSTPESDLIAGLIHPANSAKKLSPQDRRSLILRYLGAPYAKKRVSVAQSLSSLNK